MKKKLKWGVLSTAKIAREKVIPAMANSDLYEVYGIASRNLERAQETAKSLGIPKAYGSYEDLINDPEIDVIYNPLPNDMHVPMTLKCIEAGKHVLCEKPFALNHEELDGLITARDKYNVKVGEAFMVASNPQWIKARELVKSGYLGKIKAVQGFFSYFNDDKDNIRNIEEMGGGGVWDIGCYPVFTSRFVLEKEPGRLVSMLEFDPQFRTDKIGSVLIDFHEIQMTFTISTQLTPYQRMLFFGEKKILEVRIPFNAPSDQPNEIYIHEGDFSKDNAEKIVLPVSNQYTEQAIDFSKAVLEDTEVPVTLENTKANTKVLQAIFESDSSEKWVNIN
ncbi:Gfo/Idh/MocA family oxidoreductase [Cyclobacterium sp. 1_MG-2023]|uniref:Gfo/Idh/MocA family protein n=1 Tax=Cyclobacterium sp. 1_MG-2023 TaxID=3062681 RepID=UPI0026E1E598|nr:Gfo/Idh/MocA family oxidoreductase [Cyclobacterium sp. 1_MG-2023]MDO6440261.1 Gfo/Idh/MocA family oxidoreductase [Cyclobacterium sp. 1_MG-2023]